MKMLDHLEPYEGKGPCDTSRPTQGSLKADSQGTDYLDGQQPWLVGHGA